MDEKPPDDTAFDVTYLNYQLNALIHREDQVKKNLEQLRFEDSREHFRVSVVDFASASKAPTNDQRLKYMAAAPVYVFFLLLGFFLVQEIVAGRRPEMRFAHMPH